VPGTVSTTPTPTQRTRVPTRAPTWFGDPPEGGRPSAVKS
jgi:hypothetical protein